MKKIKTIGIYLWALFVISAYGHVFVRFAPTWARNFFTYPLDISLSYVVNVHLFMIIMVGFVVSGLGILCRKEIGRKLILWTEFLNLFYLFLSPFLVDPLFLRFIKHDFATLVMKFAWYVLHITLIYYFTRPGVKGQFK